jgi:hypothetical protein
MRRPILAIDFDETIAHSDPEKGYQILTLLPGAKKYIDLLAEKCEIIIWTCRYSFIDLDNMEDFLIKERIPFGGINRNSSTMTSTGFNPLPKIFADVYIDDRGLFPIEDWKDIYEAVVKRLRKIGFDWEERGVL